MGFTQWPLDPMGLFSCITSSLKGTLYTSKLWEWNKAWSIFDVNKVKC